VPEAPNLPRASEPGIYDRFGHALAAGDFNNDGRDDLAVGVPNEDIGLVLDAGAVHIIFGSASRLVSTGNLFRHQDSLGLNNANPETVAEVGDNFGSALAAGDFNGNNRDDLAIGVPEETIGPVTFGAGMIKLLVF
jgi:hypothetical protein